MNIFSRRGRVHGFTIVELLVVIVVIGILATLSVVAYNGVQQSARDKALLSDIENVENEITRYSVKNSGAYDSVLAWNSSQGSNPNISFTPSPGNVIVVTTTGDGYCIKAYNPDSNAKTLANAIKRGGGEVGCVDGWTTLAFGDVFTCAIASDNNAYCWGMGANGRLGNGASNDSNVPVAVTTSGALAGKTIKQLVASTSGSMCAIASDNNAYCWGRGSSGRLGNGTSNDSNVPVAVTTSGALAGKTIKQIVASLSGYMCAIASDNNAYCWGSGLNGQLGNGVSSNSTVPVAVTTSGALSGKTIKQLVVGVNFTCAIASDSNAYCWGTSSYLGNGASGNSNVPVAVTTSGALAGKTVKQLVASDNNVCVIASDSNAYCWGSGLNGQLGNGASGNSNVPVAVTTSGALAGKTVKQLALSESGYMCAIASDNNAYCWGSGSAGQLGNGASGNSNVPVAVTTSGALAGKTIKQLLAPASSTMCAIASDNNPYCWGSGLNGRLGNGVSSNSNSNVPVAVTTSGALAGKTVKRLATSGYDVCTIASDDNIYCWGQGSDGQLGNGVSSNSNVPVLVIRPEGI